MKWSRGPIIGKGAFSTVSLAILNNELILTNQLIASKSSPLPNSSFLRHEESILTDLTDCPHIIKCLGHDITHEGGEDYYNLLLEYLPYGHLKGPLPEPVIKRHARTLLQGLRSIHGKGYVHCDVKPRNHLIDSNGNLKIADFGLAKRQYAKSERSICGTPLYMSPEAVAGSEFEAPMDVWAAGCVVVEMFTSAPAWGPVPDPWGLMMRIGYGDEVPDAPNGLSDAGKDFVRRCLVRDPSERWTAEMLLKHPFLQGVHDDDGLDTKKNVSPQSVFKFDGDLDSVCRFDVDADDLSKRIRDLATEWGKGCSDCESDEGWIEVRTVKN